MASKQQQRSPSLIRAVGETAYLKHRGAGQFSGDTAYFGKNSRRWGLKCYSKGNEIKVKGHKLPLNYVLLKCSNMLTNPYE